MTEERLLGDDLLPLVQFVHGQSARKRILFVVASSRTVWDFIPDTITKNALTRLDRDADEVGRSGARFEHNLATEGALVTLAHFAHQIGQPNVSLAATVREAFARYVPEIYAHVFRPVAFDPDWRTSDVMLLAQRIYAEREFGAMPILADALQDAGCDSDDILNHCRDTAAPHVRGCWALDLVLGKE